MTKKVTAKESHPMKAPDKNDIEDLKFLARDLRAAAQTIECFVEGVYTASGKFPKELHQIAKNLEGRHLQLCDLIEVFTEGEEDND